MFTLVIDNTVGAVKFSEANTAMVMSRVPKILISRVSEEASCSCRFRIVFRDVFLGANFSTKCRYAPLYKTVVVAATMEARP